MNVVNHRFCSEYSPIDVLLAVFFSLGGPLISAALFDSISFSPHIDMQHTSQTVNNTINTTLLSGHKALSNKISPLQKSTDFLEMNNLFQEASEAEEIQYEGE